MAQVSFIIIHSTGLAPFPRLSAPPHSSQRERKGEACLLTLHLLELDIRTPARGSTRGRDLTRRRRGARCAPGKFGGFTFIILKLRAEGYETEIVANFAVRGPINRLTCMRKTQAQNTLTVWVFASDETRARRNTATKLHGTSPRGETKFH